MEVFKILIDQPGEFDAVLIDCLPECGDLRLITKDDATESGRALVMLTFTVDVDGEPRTAQCVTTTRLFRTAAAAVLGNYDEEGYRRQ